MNKSAIKGTETTKAMGLRLRRSLLTGLLGRAFARV